MLRQFDVPMTTTHVAAHFAVAPATASEHLRILTGSGLLRSFHRGREVYYQRTALGESVAMPTPSACAERALPGEEQAASLSA
ncbi:helix-turn-helix domain-containing protein [Microbacterium sp. zg-YB36]|uniref:helix-turn-helix domain-containing protein n=1 Tax=Microbacterium sp. zg-YB36 TaxID=2969407 RepID=UPI00214AA1E9|nr:helix-turn-helix domain-containing protein [Microbacterium sp. zg-YB36]MDL5352410.1 helix-turn-helix domain-containing protein [Microbacterium sp. zg-YB36]